MNGLIDHLRNVYAPLGMIVYGSYSNGTQSEESDFDALLICREGEFRHDTTVVDGVLLDVFIYSLDAITQTEDYGEFVQIYDGIVVEDDSRTASRLMENVRRFVNEYPKTTPDEKADLQIWCKKMLHRATRCDAEGAYRAHWLLVDSLEIYCNTRDIFYFGPKKTINWMKHHDPTGFGLFSNALRNKTELSAWISYIFEEEET